jgi:hypothetical protein
MWPAMDSINRQEARRRDSCFATNRPTGLRASSGQIVVDATGVYGNPAPPDPEVCRTQETGPAIRRGTCRATRRGQALRPRLDALIGDGHSAATALVWLDQAARVVRRFARTGFTAGPAPFRDRRRSSSVRLELARRCQPDRVSKAWLAAIRAERARLSGTGIASGWSWGRTGLDVDRVLALGYHPDLTMTRELRCTTLHVGRNDELAAAIGTRAAAGYSQVALAPSHRNPGPTSLLGTAGRNPSSSSRWTPSRCGTCSSSWGPSREPPFQPRALSRRSASATTPPHHAAESG